MSSAAVDAELCVTFQVCINYADSLESSCGHEDLSKAAVVHRIFTTERDRVLCQSLQQSSRNQSQCVVGIVGTAHVPGIIEQWKLSTTDTALQNRRLSGVQRPAQSEDVTLQGVRRALLDRFLELSCSSAVCADMQRQLTPLPHRAMHAYAFTQELYGSPRMLLAALPQEHLDKVRTW